MSEGFQSGFVNIDNLSGGVFKSATPNTIPETSLSDVGNYDVENSGIRTRRGFEKYSTVGHRPGCLKFGFSENQRTHYIRVTGGDFGPTPTSDTDWNCTFYAKENSATASTRTLITFTNTTNQELLKLQWETTGGIKLYYKETASDAWNTVSYTSTTKSQFTDYLFGVSMAISGTTITASILNANSVLASATATMTALTWDTYSRLIVGCDSNLTYPESDWTDTNNTAMFGLFGELVLTKNTGITATTFNQNFNVIAPAYHTQTANKIAYYPLRNDYSDQWGLSPTFKPTDIYRGASGLGFYKVTDRELNSIRFPLYVNKSWHIDTFDVLRHVYGEATSVGTTFQEYFITETNDYTITFDFLPQKFGVGSEDYTFFESKKYGPRIKFSRVNDNTTRIKYAHVWNSTGNTATSNEITVDLENKRPYKLSMEYVGSAGSAVMKIFKDLGQVATETVSHAHAVTTATTWQLGVNDVSNISFDGYVSGLIFHKSAVGTSWGEKPPAQIADVTTYSLAPATNAFAEAFPWLTFGTGEPTQEQLAAYSDTRWVETNISSKNIAENQKVYSFDELPGFANIFGMYLANEVTGYDTGTSLTPHGILENGFGNRDNNMDFKLRSNTAPYWIADREEITSTGYLDDVYDQDVDNLIAYSPNDSSTPEILLARNMSLTNNTGTTNQFTDTYKYFDRTDEDLRGFNYGKNLYLHNQNYHVKYNGFELQTLEIPTPTTPLSVSGRVLGTGLKGYYAYTYTFVGKNGFESYPAPVTATSINLGVIDILCDLKIRNQSYISESVTNINFYRNRGTTTATTNLSQDAGSTMYLLKTLPIDTIKNNVGTTWFTDNVADGGLVNQSPPLPNSVDMMPPCKYSALYAETAYFTGNVNAPDFIYKSMPENPALLSTLREFRTEDGDDCTGVGALGYGIVAFKKNKRIYFPGGIGSGDRTFEYSGGCLSHDSLVTIDNKIYGLGPSGFFSTDGHNYINISTIRNSSNGLSSLQYTLDNDVSDADKESSRAIKHLKTNRYLCQVGDIIYTYDLERDLWMIYRDVVGKLISFEQDVYIYLKGRLYKEVTGDSTVGTSPYATTITSGGVGYVIVTSTTALPTTNEEGLPCYVDEAVYFITDIDSLGGTSYKVWLNTNTDFTTTSTTECEIGVIRCYADTKFFDNRTPGRNKLYNDRLTVGHSNTTNGEIHVRYARNNGSFDDTFDNFVADTDVDKLQTIMRVRSENVSLRFVVKDGLEHTIRSIYFPYKQDSVQ